MWTNSFYDDAQRGHDYVRKALVLFVMDKYRVYLLVYTRPPQKRRSSRCTYPSIYQSCTALHPQIIQRNKHLLARRRPAYPPRPDTLLQYPNCIPFMLRKCGCGPLLELNFGTLPPLDFRGNASTALALLLKLNRSSTRLFLRSFT